MALLFISEAVFSVAIFLPLPAVCNLPVCQLQCTALEQCILDGATDMSDGLHRDTVLRF